MRPLVFAFALASLVAHPGHAKDHAPPFKPVTGAFIALSVPSMSESVQWYREKLGLAVTFEVREGFEVTVLEGGGLIVELVRNPAAQPRPDQPDLVHGPFKAGFRVKDFDAALAELRRRGVTIAFGPFPAREGQRANVIVRDPAGNLIQIFGD